MRKFLPPVAVSWIEMHSDEAMSQLAFEGVGQLYITHRIAWCAF